MNDAPLIRTHHHGGRVHAVATLPGAVPRWARGSRPVRRLRDYVKRWELSWRHKKPGRESARQQGIGSWKYGLGATKRSLRRDAKEARRLAKEGPYA